MLAFLPSEGQVLVLTETLKKIANDTNFSDIFMNDKIFVTFHSWFVPTSTPTVAHDIIHGTFWKLPYYPAQPTYNVLHIDDWMELTSATSSILVW